MVKKSLLGLNGVVPETNDLTLQPEQVPAGPPRRNASQPQYSCVVPKANGSIEQNDSSFSNTKNGARPTFQKQRSISELLSFSEPDSGLCSMPQKEEKPLYNPYASKPDKERRQPPSPLVASATALPLLSSSPMASPGPPFHVTKIRPPSQHSEQQVTSSSSRPLPPAPPPPPPQPSFPHEEPPPFHIGTKSTSSLVSHAHESLQRERQEKLKEQAEEMRKMADSHENDPHLHRQGSAELARLRHEQEEFIRRQRETAENEERLLQKAKQEVERGPDEGLLRQESFEEARLRHEQEEFIRTQREAAENEERQRRQEADQLANEENSKERAEGAQEEETLMRTHEEDKAGRLDKDTVGEQHGVTDSSDDQGGPEEKTPGEKTDEVFTENDASVNPSYQVNKEEESMQFEEWHNAECNNEESVKVPDSLIQILPETLEEFNKAVDDMTSSTAARPPLPPLVMPASGNQEGKFTPSRGAADQDHGEDLYDDFDDPIVLESMDENEIKPNVVEQGVGSLRLDPKDILHTETAAKARKNRKAIDEAMTRQRASLSPSPMPKLEISASKLQMMNTEKRKEMRKESPVINNGSPGLRPPLKSLPSNDSQASQNTGEWSPMTKPATPYSPLPDPSQILFGRQTTQSAGTANQRQPHEQGVAEQQYSAPSSESRRKIPIKVTAPLSSNASLSHVPPAYQRRPEPLTPSPAAHPVSRPTFPSSRGQRVVSTDAAGHDLNLRTDMNKQQEGKTIHVRILPASESKAPQYAHAPPRKVSPGSASSSQVSSKPDEKISVPINVHPPIPQFQSKPPGPKAPAAPPPAPPAPPAPQAPQAPQAPPAPAPPALAQGKESRTVPISVQVGGTHPTHQEKPTDRGYATLPSPSSSRGVPISAGPLTLGRQRQSAQTPPPVPSNTPHPLISRRLVATPPPRLGHGQAHSFFGDSFGFLGPQPMKSMIA